MINSFRHGDISQSSYIKITEKNLLKTVKKKAISLTTIFLNDTIGSLSFNRK